jgi:hypothetical protein
MEARLETSGRGTSERATSTRAASDSTASDRDISVLAASVSWPRLLAPRYLIQIAYTLPSVSQVFIESRQDRRWKGPG